jgi:hypothetical protein
MEKISIIALRRKRQDGRFEFDREDRRKRENSVSDKVRSSIAIVNVIASKIYLAEFMRDSQDFAKYPLTIFT